MYTRMIYVSQYRYIYSWRNGSKIGCGRSRLQSKRFCLIFYLYSKILILLYLQMKIFHFPSTDNIFLHSFPYLCCEKILFCDCKHGFYRVIQTWYLTERKLCNVGTLGDHFLYISTVFRMIEKKKQKRNCKILQPI